MWKYNFLSPPPYRAMLLVIELKLCSTMLVITVNIVLKGEGGGVVEEGRSPVGNNLLILQINMQVSIIFVKD
jgi:hypothetical protein